MGYMLKDELDQFLNNAKKEIKQLYEKVKQHPLTYLTCVIVVTVAVFSLIVLPYWRVTQFGITNTTDFANVTKIINKDNANFLSALAGIFSALGSFLLLFVTMIYVVLTSKQVNIAKESIDLNKNYLKQSESQNKTSVTPILELINIKVHGGRCYTSFNGSLNRKLYVYWDMKNTGNYPAIQIYNKIEFKLKFIGSDNNSFSSRYRYAGSLSTNDKRTASVEFDIDKLSLLLADITAMLKHNNDVVTRNLGENLVSGATLVVNCVFTNYYDQYFKTVYEGYVHHITVKDKEGKERNLWALEEQMLKRDEEFDIIIPFYHLKFSPLSDIETDEFKKEYEDLEECKGFSIKPLYDA